MEIKSVRQAPPLPKVEKVKPDQGKQEQPRNHKKNQGQGGSEEPPQHVDEYA